MDRKTGALLGALTADAAAMGLHWLYDQRRIEEVAGAAPEFRAPNAADFTGPEGKPLGYFAHGGKRAGEPSHYGAQMLAMATSLARAGAYDAEDYARAFREAFGAGGGWTGYIDRPTRAVLVSMDGAAEGAPLSACGADDAQLPALSKLPPLLVRHHGEAALPGMVESAVRVTNDRDDAAEWGAAFAAMLAAAIEGAAPADCAAAARGISARIDAQAEAALARRGETPEAVAADFGLHCQLEVAFPVILQMLATAADFASAAQANIRAGGDSCGRAIPLGAILGASFAGDGARGVPAGWLSRVSVPGALAALF
ncbi:MAG: ADP-ribosylglycohydrolase family protein [Pikeienuella sp.]|uniref:ADP-ribosylglycohydrolase family protein n=1 Tax=Pikeienuella sp. TaxID=2831957 RepID=UPI00391B7384